MSISKENTSDGDSEASIIGHLLSIWQSASTYCAGPRLIMTRDITKADFMKICDVMGCCPEAVCEGGFRYLSKPGYKSLRFGHPNWPWITDTTAAEWRNNGEVLMAKGMWMTTTLRAHEGAKVFTTSEIEEWRHALASAGIEMQDLSKCPDIHQRYPGAAPPRDDIDG
jgi:hypothetical protein